MIQHLGRFSPASATTGSNGNAITTFTTTTKSGRAQINVLVIGSTPTVSNTTYLNIDHGDPYEILTPANYTGEQTVGGTIDIKLKLVDKYGNLIDNKGPINPAHPTYEQVDFQVTSPVGGQGAYFKNLTTFQFTDQKQTLTVNDTGIIFTTLESRYRARRQYCLGTSPFTGT